MTLSDLISDARQRAEDTLEPYLWTDLEWTRYANEAQREAARRARLLVDSSTAEICAITLVASQKTYALDSRIIFIRRARLTGSTRPLGRVSYKDLDRQTAGWEDETGEPIAYVPDMDTGLFRPYPTPDAAGSANLTVVRLPLVDMEDGDDEPEINSRYHDSLIFWMLYKAYSKHDAETRDEKKAAENLGLFEQEFGTKSSAIDEAWAQTQYGFTEDEGQF